MKNIITKAQVLEASKLATSAVETIADHAAKSGGNIVLAEHPTMPGQKVNPASVPEIVADHVAGESVPEDSNIGRTWQATYGLQKIVSRENMPSGDLYGVETVGVGSIRRYDVARIEEIIKSDEHRLTPAYAAELAERAETARLRTESDARQAAKQAKIESEIAEFTASLTPMLAGKYKAALLKLASYNGSVSTRKDFIENQVAMGCTIELPTEPGNACRYLKTADGGYFTEDQTTKAGIEYALYLIANRPAIEPAKPSLAAVKPLSPVLPDPEKPFEIASQADIRVIVSAGIVLHYEVLTRAGGNWTRGVVLLGAKLEALKAVFEDLTFDVIQAPAPVAIACEFQETPAIECAVTVKPPLVVRIIRRDENGQIINGNFPTREATGPVILPPIPPRKGSVLANMIEAGERLAAMMRGESQAPAIAARRALLTPSPY